MIVKKLVVFVLCALCGLSVRAQELLNYPLDTVNGEEVYRYEVERSVGLYRIGVNFNVTPNEVVRLNPQLKERGLHYGEILLIPTGRKVEAKPQVVESAPRVIETRVTETRVLPVEAKQAEAKPAEKPVEKAAEVQPEVEAEFNAVTADTVAKADTVVTSDSVVADGRRVVELALMLPFESQQTKRSANAERMTEFYQGVLLALHELQNDSTLYRLRVYDTERSERRVAALCESNELDSVRAVLGLAYSIQIERMANWCDAHQVPLLLPFSDDSELARHPQMLQFNSTDEQKADSLCRWIARRDAQCITVEAREADISPSTRALRKMLKQRNIATKAIPMTSVMNDSATVLLDPDRENIIILHSDRYMHVRLLIPHLMKWKEAGFKIRLVSHYAWQKERIDLPQVYASMFTGSGKSSKYEALWSKYFAMQHMSAVPRYDLLGYDLMHTLIAWMQGERAHEGLQSTIRWQQLNSGGWQNANVEVVEK